ncbi:hypothetical protein RR46_08958 [Papilio xuthus]|uniref:Uncharacterized protein n=1 Tax=Papilio xuthus TaxID=66420 RepID=A0A194PRX3_PAPXU|nr:hypothetical protein RR46_08958 [Papilio xuthus]
MPDWRYNVLSTSEAFLDGAGPPRDPLVSSYPRRADRTRPLHTCPYTTIFLGSRSHVPYRLPAHSENGDTFTDAYSVDRSSNLTDTSSFARYEDCRPQIDETLSEENEQVYSDEKTDENLPLQVQKVPYTSSVYYISAKTETLNKDGQGTDLFLVEASESDALSSCTRSPKAVESPEDFCDKTVDEDGASARSDMDGLDLTLFEPAQTESEPCEGQPSTRIAGSASKGLCGVLYAVPDSGNGKLNEQFLIKQTERNWR